MVIFHGEKLDVKTYEIFNDDLSRCEKGVEKKHMKFSMVIFHDVKSWSKKTYEIFDGNLSRCWV